MLRILLDNALGAHARRAPTSCSRRTRDDGRVRLAGHRPRHRHPARRSCARVFEPFYTSDGAQGSGLGLAIARELAERMGGELTAESVPGRTTFALALPRLTGR